MRIHLKNMSGEALEVNTPAGKTFHFGVGQTEFHVETEPLTFTKSDGSSFTVELASEVSDLEVYEGGYTLSGAPSFWSSYTVGFELGLVIMFAAISLRMVKQLGYHSQDI